MNVAVTWIKALTDLLLRNFQKASGRVKDKSGNAETIIRCVTISGFVNLSYSFVNFCFIYVEAMLLVAYKLICPWCIELLSILTDLWISINFLNCRVGPFVLFKITNAYVLIFTMLLCSNDIFQREK